jgi:hypothetical protein
MAESHQTYHQVDLSFWFPRIRWLSWAVTTAYLTAIVEVIRIGWRFESPSPERTLSVIAVVLLVMPGLVFFELCQIGYQRVMEKREAASGQDGAPRPKARGADSVNGGKHRTSSF